MEAESSKETNKPDEASATNTASFCPLFMDSLPSNFSENPQLAAIASLLDEETEEEIIPCKEEEPKPGGGKIGARSTTRRRARRQRSAPYTVPKGKSGAAKIGEAQLFLSMWKI